MDAANIILQQLLQILPKGHLDVALLSLRVLLSFLLPLVVPLGIVPVHPRCGLHFLVQRALPLFCFCQSEHFFELLVVLLGPDFPFGHAFDDGLPRRREMLLLLLIPEYHHHFLHVFHAKVADAHQFGHILEVLRRSLIFDIVGQVFVGKCFPNFLALLLILGRLLHVQLLQQLNQLFLGRNAVHILRGRIPARLALLLDECCSLLIHVFASWPSQLEFVLALHGRHILRQLKRRVLLFLILKHAVL